MTENKENTNMQTNPIFEKYIEFLKVQDSDEHKILLQIYENEELTEEFLSIKTISILLYYLESFDISDSYLKMIEMIIEHIKVELSINESLINLEHDKSLIWLLNSSDPVNMINKIWENFTILREFLRKMLTYIILNFKIGNKQQIKKHLENELKKHLENLKRLLSEKQIENNMKKVRDDVDDNL